MYPRSSSGAVTSYSLVGKSHCWNSSRYSGMKPARSPRQIREYASALRSQMSAPGSRVNFTSTSLSSSSLR